MLKGSADLDFGCRMAWFLSFLGVLMMWMFWSCVYMAQMYPLYKPIMAEVHHVSQGGKH